MPRANSKNDYTKEFNEEHVDCGNTCYLGGQCLDHYKMVPTCIECEGNIFVYPLNKEWVHMATHKQECPDGKGVATPNGTAHLYPNA